MPSFRLKCDSHFLENIYCIFQYNFGVLWECDMLSLRHVNDMFSWCYVIRSLVLVVFKTCLSFTFWWQAYCKEQCPLLCFEFHLLLVVRFSQLLYFILLTSKNETNCDYMMKILCEYRQQSRNLLSKKFFIFKSYDCNIKSFWLNITLHSSVLIC